MMTRGLGLSAEKKKRQGGNGLRPVLLMGYLWAVARRASAAPLAGPAGSTQSFFFSYSFLFSFLILIIDLVSELQF